MVQFIRQGCQVQKDKNDQIWPFVVSKELKCLKMKKGHKNFVKIINIKVRILSKYCKFCKDFSKTGLNVYYFL